MGIQKKILIVLIIGLMFSFGVTTYLGMKYQENQLLKLNQEYPSLNVIEIVKFYEIRLAIFLFLGVTFVLVILKSFFIYKYVKKPVDKLISTLAEVIDGDLDIQDKLKSKDEFNQLSSEINFILQKIKDSRDKYIEKEAKLAKELIEKNIILEKTVKKLSAVNKVSVALSSELDIEKLLKLVINILVKGLRAEIGFLMLIDDKNELIMNYGVGLSKDILENGSIKIGNGISGTVAKEGVPLLIKNVKENSHFESRSKLGFERRTVICVPLKTKEKILGIVNLTNKRGDESFNEDDLEILNIVASQAAIAIENAVLYKDIQKSYFGTIRSLVQALEEKDKYTRGHSERVTRQSIKIAKKLELTPKQIKVIQYAGILHDIGKIGIDSKILHKKGELTSEEYKIIKEHPVIGKRIIEPIEFLKEVTACMVQHHERVDGKGYPCGYYNKELTIEAQILSVADAYDAMISNRPYRQALDKEKAIQELKKHSGTQFNQEIVNTFVKILEEEGNNPPLDEDYDFIGA